MRGEQQKGPPAAGFQDRHHLIQQGRYIAGVARFERQGWQPQQGICGVIEWRLQAKGLCVLQPHLAREMREIALHRERRGGEHPGRIQFLPKRGEDLGDVQGGDMQTEPAATALEPAHLAAAGGRIQSVELARQHGAPLDTGVHAAAAALQCFEPRGQVGDRLVEFLQRLPHFLVFDQLLPGTAFLEPFVHGGPEFVQGLLAGVHQWPHHRQCPGYRTRLGGDVLQQVADLPGGQRAAEEP